MLLSQKVQAIEEVFLLLDQEMSTFREWSGLYCKSGCGKCCHKADIEATELEFLPFANYLYNSNQYSEWLTKLEQNRSSLCVLFDPAKTSGGLCSQYAYRGLICRLFGYSARTNKYSQREFITCQTIKSEQTAAFTDTVGMIQRGGIVPVMNNYYMRLHSIDPDLSQHFYPINEAIQRAIQTVLHYHAYS